MKSNRFFKQPGFSLIELMVAMALGTFLLAGVIQIFISNKQSYRLQEGQSRVQENARYVLELLGRDVREAGYTGCRGLNKITTVKVGNPPLPSFDLNSAVIGRWWDQSSSSWSVTIPATVTNVVAGTDVLTIQRGDSCGATITDNAASATMKVAWPNSCGLKAGDATLVTDCSTAHMFKVTTAPEPSPSSLKQTVTHGSNNNTATHLCTEYTNPYPADNNGLSSCVAGAKIYTSPPAQLLKFASYTYFIALGTNGLPSLFRLDNSSVVDYPNNPVELVEGVENMQITYGIGVSGIASSYAADTKFPTPPTAPAGATPNDWADVISARIDLLFESIDENITIGDQSFIYNGATVTSSDGRIRRVFSTTITIRNRML